MARASRTPKLKTLTDVSRFMARLIREVYHGNFDAAKAGRLAYMCNILRGCLSESDLERRIEEIERQIRGEINA